MSCESYLFGSGHFRIDLLRALPESARGQRWRHASEAGEAVRCIGHAHLCELQCRRDRDGLGYIGEKHLVGTPDMAGTDGQDAGCLGSLVR